MTLHSPAETIGEAYRSANPVPVGPLAAGAVTLASNLMREAMALDVEDSDDELLGAEPDEVLGVGNEAQVEEDSNAWMDVDRLW